jgi:hypothetical protein
MSKERIHFHIRDGNERYSLTNRICWSRALPFQAQPPGLPTSIEVRKRAESFEELDLIRQYASHPRPLSIVTRTYLYAPGHTMVSLAAESSQSSVRSFMIRGLGNKPPSSACLLQKHKQSDGPCVQLYLYQDSPSFVLACGRNLLSRNLVAAWACYPALVQTSIVASRNLIQERRDQLRSQSATLPLVSRTSIPVGGAVPCCCEYNPRFGYISRCLPT